MEHVTDERDSNCFDFLRLFAAFTVLIGHMTERIPLNFLWVNVRTTEWFRDGVPLFFVISGFLVYRSCEQCLDRVRPLRQYFLNRLLRIAPALYAYTAGVVILLLVLGGTGGYLLETKRFFLWIVSQVALVAIFNPGLNHKWGVPGGVLTVRSGPSPAK